MKAFNCLLFMMSLGGAYPSVAQDITSDLIASYSFIGNLNDASGNGIHGTNYGAVLTADRKGSSDCAYNFSNTAWVELNDNGKLNITSSLTIAAWIRSTNTSSYQKILTKEEPGKGAFRFSYNGNDQSLQFDQGTTFARCTSSNNTVSRDVWHFVAAVREGDGTSSGQIKFYVDGQLINATQLLEAPQSVTRGATISDWDTSPTGHFVGDLDEIFVYTRALSQSDIQLLYASTTLDCVVYYPFIGNLNDASGNGIHGTNYGAVLTADRKGSSDCAYNFTDTAWVELNDNGKLNITSSLTIVAWIRSTNTSSYQKILSKEEPGKGAFRFSYNGNDQSLRFDQGTTFASCTSYNNTVSRDVWHFVAAVREGDGTSSGQIKFYVDGQLINATQLSEAPQSVTRGATISDWDTSPTGHFVGDIDEIWVYSRAFSAVDIQSSVQQHFGCSISVSTLSSDTALSLPELPQSVQSIDDDSLWLVRADENSPHGVQCSRPASSGHWERRVGSRVSRSEIRRNESLQRSILLPLEGGGLCGDKETLAGPIDPER